MSAKASTRIASMQRFRWMNLINFIISHTARSPVHSIPLPHQIGLLAMSPGTVICINSHNILRVSCHVLDSNTKNIAQNCHHFQTTKRRRKIRHKGGEKKAKIENQEKPDYFTSYCIVIDVLLSSCLTIVIFNLILCRYSVNGPSVVAPRAFLRLFLHSCFFYLLFVRG